MKTCIVNTLSHSRTLALLLLAVALVPATAGTSLAEVHYVDVNSANATPPYTNWATAATNIQDAVDVAAAGDEVVVTNGAYYPVGVGKPLNVRSVNGPQFTTISGGAPCAYLTNDATLSGFTLVNGRATNGGGVWCESLTAVVSNCVLRGNIAFESGGGAYGGTLNNCKLDSNSAGDEGGGAYGCELNNCTFTGNQADSFPDPRGIGGGEGGGVSGCWLNNCKLTGNSAYNWGGGAFSSTLNNCTLSGNRVIWRDASGGGASFCTLNNCIVYFNFTPSGNGANYDYDRFDGSSTSVLNFCCSTPLPPPGNGAGNITTAPLFVNANGWANLRLQSNSPCIDAGDDSYVLSSTDLDGRPRIAGVEVDIGAYEFQAGVSGVFIGWLLQYSLPTDGSADSADPDGDGVDNYHEWLAGTDPTNALSSPAELTIIPSGANVILTWPTNAVGFTLQSTTNLVSPTWATNSPSPVVIAGQNTVTNPMTGAQKFYRLIQ